MGDTSRKAKDRLKKQNAAEKDQKKASAVAKANPPNNWAGAAKKAK
jgi:hypothetical protein